MTRTTFARTPRALWRTHLAPRLAPHWQRLSAREQTLLRALGGLLGLALAWSVLIAPALHTLRHGAERRETLARQLTQMRALHAQAQALQQQRRAVPANGVQVLQKLAAINGWSVQPQGERVLVQVKAATPAALAQWLAQAREQAQALPLEARLQRSSGPAPVWEGSLWLRLPPARSQDDHGAASPVSSQTTPPARTQALLGPSGPPGAFGPPGSPGDGPPPRPRPLPSP